MNLFGISVKWYLKEYNYHPDCKYIKIQVVLCYATVNFK